eukprot:10160211-Karenia_brevis.AAC.1
MPAAFDFAFTSPHRQDVLVEASRSSGFAARTYEQHKRNYLNTATDCQQQGFSFVPFVGEPSGGWGPSAICTLKSIARARAVKS